MRPFSLLAVALLLAGAACSSETDDTTQPPPHEPVRPSPVVNEQTSHDAPYEDAPFAADVPTLFRTTDVLPDLDVTALALSSGAVYAGTASGLYRLAPGAAAFADVGLPGTGAIVDLAVLGDGRVVAARAGEVHVLTAAGAPGEVWPVAGEAIAAVAAHGQGVYVGTDLGLSSVDANGAAPVAQGFAVRDLAVQGDVVWIATAAGVRRHDLATSTTSDVDPADLPDPDVRALAATGDGAAVLAATATGLARLDAAGGGATKLVPATDGLPNADLRAVAEAGGEVLTGHGIGATAMSAERKDHYHSERWLPADEVTRVALEADGTRWIATHAGLSRIGFVQTTLADKAARLEPLVARHWRMDGFVDDSVTFADPYDQSSPQTWDNDNDGLWTEMQIAAWCFAYDATKDEELYARARKAMDTMFLLEDVPGETFAARGLPRGFIARSLVRDDEGAVFDDKATRENWHEQAFGGHTYYWKDDTSSDEYAGHFFGMPIFHDLCAKTDEERAEVRDRMARAMDYVIDGGYLLLDLDGEGTTHGKWKDLSSSLVGLGPCLAAGGWECAESYGGGGWLNSIEILGHLLATWHVTGDARYYDEYERLAITERYGEMIPLTDHTFTVTSRHQANHSDHELASLAYFTLLRYEPNADRLAIWKQSLADLAAAERPERNPLLLGVVSSAIGDDQDLAGAARTLREMPEDMREWHNDKSHRLDVTVDEALDRFDDPQFTTVLPYDEIQTMKWNKNPYAVVGGGSGNEVQGPWPYLMPYWMMRRYGAIR